MGGPSPHDAAFADMIQGLKNEAVNRGATSLMDEEVSTLGVPDPRILIVGCGGSGNNTLNRITHLGVEGAVTVAINTERESWWGARQLIVTHSRVLLCSGIPQTIDNIAKDNTARSMAGLLRRIVCCLRRTARCFGNVKSVTRVTETS